MNKTEWITDRRPTREDADANLDVLTMGGRQHWECIIEDEKWIPMPASGRTIEDVVKELVKHWDDRGDRPLILHNGPSVTYIEHFAPLMNELQKLVEENQ